MRSFKRFLAVATLGALLAWPLSTLAQDAGQTAAQAAAAAVQTAVQAGNETGLITQAWNAINRGDYWPAAVILLIAAVWFIRMDHTKIPYIGALIDKTLGKAVKWSRSDRGGVLSVFVTSALGGLLTSWAGTGKPSFDLHTFKLAGGLGVAAIGGFMGVRKLIWPSDKVDSSEAPTQPNANKPGA